MFIRNRIVFASAVLGLFAASGAAQGWGGDGTWAFLPQRDDFRADALLDLRPLNEKTAGQSGFVKVDPQGSFRLGDGTLERFWAVNTGVGRDKPFNPRPLGQQVEPDLPSHARFLAKRGVNMVRCHTQMSPDLGRHPDAKFNDINTDERDWCWRVVAAMKKEGVYTTISPYWAVPMKFSKNWGFTGGTDQGAFGLLFYDPMLQKAYKAWLKALLTEKNPYTGIPLGQDPSLAILELQNEDSLLFWTFQGIKGAQKQNLEKLFATWAVGKYGSIDKLKSAWAGAALPEDNANAPAFDFYGMWEVAQQQTGAKAVRLGDQIEFLTETMRKFNKQIVDYIRNDLGCKVLVNAGNWRTADPIRMNDAERYSYLPTEVDANNKYFDGVHKGPNSGWAILNGDQFTNPSVLRDPKPLPTNLKQTKGRPILITESSWVMPMAYSTEGPFLVSAYQSLTGVNAYYWFATGDDEWTQPMSANGYMPSQMKWIFGSPDMLGTFPAAALMYRKGYIKQGSPVVEEQRSLSDIWSRKTPVISEEPSYDPNRDAGDIAASSSVKSGLSPLAFLVGPVTVQFGGNPENTKTVNLSKYIDSNAMSVKSITGELELNYDKGFCVLDSPCAQGVTAFFSSKPMVRTTDVTFLSQNEYGAAIAVSLDGKPLASSSKILVQFGTRSRPTGWTDKPASISLDGGKTVQGMEVVSYGKAPWQVQRAKLDVIIKNFSLRKATVLDMNGNARQTVPLEKSAAGIRFKFPTDAMYVVLEG